jgi:hypothetical protein
MAPLQVAVGTRGGAEIAIHGIRAQLDANRNHIAIAIDLKNAFGSIPCVQIANALNKLQLEPTLYTRWFFNHFGAPDSRVVLPGGTAFTYNVGVPQGGPTSMQWFCLAVFLMVIICVAARLQSLRLSWRNLLMRLMAVCQFLESVTVFRS